MVRHAATTLLNEKRWSPIHLCEARTLITVYFLPEQVQGS